MSTSKRPRNLAELARYKWPPTTPFTHRLAKLRQAVQKRIDEIPNDQNPYTPRLKAVVKLSLTDLRAILPPREQKVLDCLRAKKPPHTLLGLPGLRDERTLRLVVQRTISRVQRLCGSKARYRLLQHHDRRGHGHRRRRPGHPRALPALERIPRLTVYVPAYLAADPHEGLRVLDRLPNTHGSARYAA
jgi:hypothetical protein